MSTITDHNPYVEEMLRLMKMSHELGLRPHAKNGACYAFYEFIDDAHGADIADETWFDAYEIFKSERLQEMFASERQKEVSNV